MLQVNLYSSIELRHLVIWSLNRKALDILTDDWKTTFNLMPLLQVRNISISCLFTWVDIFAKNSKDTVTIIIIIIIIKIIISAADKTQYFVHLSFKSTLQLINVISSDIQKLHKAQQLLHFLEFHYLHQLHCCLT